MRGGDDPERRHERGAASLETTGVTIIAAMVILGVMMAALPQGRIISETFSYWVCQVVTMGQGGCTPPSTSPDAHKPTDPCVLTQDGVERNQKIAVLVVTAEDGRRIEIQKLSNGEYRVTVTDTGGVGAEVGVGGGLTVTVNDTKVGGSATAQAGASISIRDGDVYYADDDNIDDLMGALLQDQVKDTVAGDSGPIRWLTDQATDLVGVSNDLPEPDEVYAEGGISLNASAEATSLTDSAGAGVSESVLLGTRTNRDGTTTVYLKAKVSGKAGLQSLGFDTENDPQFQGARLEGSAEVVTAVTFDSEGNMVKVSATATAAGSSAGVASALFGGESDPALSNQEGKLRIYQATLPIETAADESLAGQFLLAQGVGSLGGWSNPAIGVPGMLITQNFFEAAQSRGTVTQQDYDTNSNTVFGLDASGKLGIELGVSASVQEDSMTTTGAQYWDGTQWVDWEECSA
ncbi:MAG TPA: hypothetical protein VD864_11865 [Nocardioides sp.]|nr:hypothetical protein [Nocardioides sp.]